MNRDQGTENREPCASLAEETLRLIAQLPAPEGLADRMQGRLLAQLHQAKTVPARPTVLRWPAPLGWQAAWLRSAAAVALACLIAGGGWGVAARFGSAPNGSASLPTATLPSSFSSAGAKRTPQTLNGPIVQPAPLPAIADKTAPQASSAGHDASPAHKGKPQAIKAHAAAPQP